MQEQYQGESQCQDYSDYCPSGYHPVTLGQKFKTIYTVVQKLGWGHFSTVWLTQKDNTHQYYALKIQRSKDTHTQSAIDELEMLQEIRRHENDVEWVQYLKSIQQLHVEKVNSKLCRPLLLVDHFVHHGIHGKHLCSVFELMGPNLLDVIQHYEFKDKRMPLWFVKKITRDILLGLVYLHEHCGIIHTDLKPQNIMLKLQSHQEKQLIQQLKGYKVKPISMKYLKNIHSSKNPKNKKKNQKKKMKKKLLAGEKGEKEELEEGEEDGPSQKKEESSSEVQSIYSSEISSSQPLSSEKQSNSKSLENDNISKQKTNSSQQYSISQSNHPSSQIEDYSKQKQEGKQQQQSQDMSTLKWKSVPIKLNPKLFFKIADMGNACFLTNHLTQDIQTRQYRSPEVLIGHPYLPNTDIWSLGCVVFQMMTNNFLFKPKKIPGIKKDEDHLYQIIQILGAFDKQFALKGTHSSQFFNKAGKLLSGSPKKFTSIAQYLQTKYKYDKETADQTQHFLLPMLQYDPKNRIQARDCLKSEWLWQ